MLEDSPYGKVHAVHVSELKSFESCRRRWDWIYHGLYYPFITPKPLEFGIAYHKGMEVFYNPATWEFDREVVTELAVVAFANECKKHLEWFLEATEQLSIDGTEAKADYDERIELGSGMLRHYARNISPVEDRGFRPIRVEVAFQVPLLDPQGNEVRCLCHNLLVVISGRIDMLAEDDFGGYWPFDWKTAREIRDDTSGYLELDTQLKVYCWALWRMGIPVRGFIYHEQRKGYPQPPTRNKQIRLGRMYSVNANQQTDYQTYLATVREEDSEAYEAGYYNEFLEFLKNEGIIFHRRHQVHKSEQELINCGHDLYLEVMDLLDPNIRIYPSPGRFSCSGCAFKVPCVGKNQGEDYEYTLDTMYDRRESPYVRDRPSTETKGGE